MKSYIFHAGQQFIPETDYFHLRGQVNILHAKAPLSHQPNRFS